MQDKEIKTAGGYTITMAPYLTYDQFMDIEDTWTGDIAIDLTKKGDDGKPIVPEMTKISSRLLRAANKKAIGFLVKKIIDPEGNEVKRKEDELPIHPADAKEITDIIDKVITDTAKIFEKKKGTQ